MIECVVVVPRTSTVIDGVAFVLGSSNVVVRGSVVASVVVVLGSSDVVSDSVTVCAEVVLET